MNNSMKQLSKNRDNLYRLLGRLYIKEVDASLLNALKSLKFPEKCEDEELEEGYRLLESYLRSLDASAGAGADDVVGGKGAGIGVVADDAACAAGADAGTETVLDDLAVDYARVFLSAGVAQGMAAFPYESVYTSKKRLMMQDARGFVAAAYAGAGLKTGADMYHAPEDHIGLEFEYMARLCANAPMKVQQEFFKNHLQNWVYTFTAEVMKYAQTDFYRAVSKITRGFMNMEQSLIAAPDAFAPQQ